MAEQPAKKKRRIKNPETFRERVQKNAAAGDNASATNRLKQTGGKLSKSASPVTHTVSRTYNSEFLLPVRKILSLIGKVVFPKYFRQSGQELKLVTWPGWSEGRRLTFAVLVFAIIFGAAIAGVDWVLDKIFQHLLLT
ncbi:MAG TPA: preprotein translocase subunit SecE [Candidatus Saccharimonadales bacterium]|nr:preprotein translocase subunit SecE [Candidatus Saccharimonadales bacterium]